MVKFEQSFFSHAPQVHDRFDSGRDLNGRVGAPSYRARFRLANF
jgi:hypothetical protein